MPNQISPQMQLPEPDHEGRMAKSELYRAAKMSIKLFQMIQDGQELEGWVQAKITKSADYLDSIYHYMEYQMKFGQGGQAASVADIAGDMDIGSQSAPPEEDDVKVKEGLSYEQRLNALLEGAMKKHKKVKEAPNEGNEFSGALAKAKAAGKTEFKVGGKTHQVKEGAKPDFLDIDKDGDKKEPMKKAVADKKAGPKKGVNPFAKKSVKEERTEVKDKDGNVTSWKDEGEWKKSTVKKDSRGKVTNLSDKARRETEKLSTKKTEGFSSDAKTGDTFKTAKGTTTKTATGLKHTRDKYDYDPGSDDKDDKKAKRVAKKKTESSAARGKRIAEAAIRK